MLRTFLAFSRSVFACALFFTFHFGFWSTTKSNIKEDASKQTCFKFHSFSVWALGTGHLILTEDTILVCVVKSAFCLKLFQGNRILRSNSKSIKQKPGIRRPLPMFLKRGVVHRLSRSPENQNSWSQVTDVRARAPQAMASPRVKNCRRVPLLDHEEPGL